MCVYMYLPLSKHFLSAWSLPQNTVYFAFFPDFSHLFSDSDHFFRDPWVPFTFFSAEMIVVYHIPIKIRVKNNVDSTLGKRAYKASEWEEKFVWVMRGVLSDVIFRSARNSIVFSLFCNRAFLFESEKRKNSVDSVFPAALLHYIG